VASSESSIGASTGTSTGASTGASKGASTGVSTVASSYSSSYGASSYLASYATYARGTLLIDSLFSMQLTDKTFMLANSAFFPATTT